MSVSKDQLEFYFNLYQKEELSGPETVGLFWLTYSSIWPIKNWFQYHPQINSNHNDQPQSLRLKDDPFLGQIDGLAKLPTDLTLYQFFKASHFKGIKSTAAKALGMWFEGKINLKIYNRPLEPLEILELQSNGTRCVSLFYHSPWLDHIFDHQRNAYKFLIHDLEHAWQMFHNPQLCREQIRWSQRLMKSYINGTFDFMFEDPELLKDFNYIISDMNTHPLHIEQCLKMAVLKYFRKKESTSTDSGPLSQDTEFEFQSRWNSLVTEPG
jgi:hypothetical protein